MLQYLNFKFSNSGIIHKRYKANVLEAFLLSTKWETVTILSSAIATSILGPLKSSSLPQRMKWTFKRLFLSSVISHHHTDVRKETEICPYATESVQHCPGGSDQVAGYCGSNKLPPTNSTLIKALATFSSNHYKQFLHQHFVNGTKTFAQTSTYGPQQATHWT